jgi:hypothetical protein
MKIRALYLAVAVVCAGAWNVCAADSPYVFSVGEKIGYRLTAAGFFIGNQTTMLESVEQLDGREVFVLRGYTESSRFMNLFYRVDDKWLVFLDREELVPLRLEKDMWEGKRKAYLVYHIDQQGKRVVFENRTTGSSKEKEAENLVFDLFTLAYYYRQFPEQFDNVFTFDFLEERDLQTIQFKNEGKVKIRVDPISEEDKIPAYKMKQIGGIGIEIYVSADELRIPLKIVTPARLKRGRKLNVEMNLENYTPGEGQDEVPSLYRRLAF